MNYRVQKNMITVKDENMSAMKESQAVQNGILFRNKQIIFVLNAMLLGQR